jgi:gamma-glutamyl hydrolase
MSSINGLLFTGGANYLLDTNGKLTELGARMCDMVEMATAMNNNGTHFPIWATCLGFEAVNLCTSINSISRGFTDEPPISHLLKYTTDAQESSTYTGLSKRRGERILSLYKREPLALYSHTSGVLAETYHADTALNGFWKLLATSKDRSGREFVAQVEARDYPYYA